MLISSSCNALYVWRFHNYSLQHVAYTCIQINLICLINSLFYTRWGYKSYLLFPFREVVETMSWSEGGEFIFCDIWRQKIKHSKSDVYLWYASKFHNEETTLILKLESGLRRRGKCSVCTFFSPLSGKQLHGIVMEWTISLSI